jgi:pimeloyl-ACP methyl ester carboxylesterase
MWVAQFVIRPPRRQYASSELGETHHLPDGSYVTRQSITLKNADNQTLVGSYFPAPFSAPGRPAVLMLHGNASSQVEGIFAVRLLCPHGISVLCIDTRGCGRSEGSFITLGVRERADVAAALAFLRGECGIGPIALWGRSLGAGIAVWCAAEQMDIQAIIADSPYGSLRGVVEDVIGQHWFTSSLTKVGLFVMDKFLARTAGIVSDDIKIENAESAKCPALFVHAAYDSLIGVRHSRELFARYGADEKYLVTPAGNHNSNRPTYVTVIEVEFLLRVFGLEGPADVEGNVDCRIEHFETVLDMVKRSWRIWWAASNRHAQT